MNKFLKYFKIKKVFLIKYISQNLVILHQKDQVEDMSLEKVNIIREEN